MSDVDTADVIESLSLWFTRAIISTLWSLGLSSVVSSIPNADAVTTCGLFFMGDPSVLFPASICGLLGCIWSALGIIFVPGPVSSGFCPSLWTECVFLPSLSVHMSTIWMGL